ncbi:nucleotide sugar dehydrogenase [Planococcus sp. MERTA32b]|nr:nucleotide sugar dehydrogenase [Planococcus sp. MER TA 32b]
MDYYTQLQKKIEGKKALAGVIGLGYVGLPLALEMAKAGFQTIGFDTNPGKVEIINNGNSYIKDINEAVLKKAVEDKKLHATNRMDTLMQMDIISVCVPTPLNRDQQPDITYINSAIDAIENAFHKGVLIILESTTYPGTTEELIEKRFEVQGYRAGEDYFLCYSPERIDPGNPHYTTKTTPKIIGGSTSRCLELGELMYSTFIDELVKVSSPRTAEMAKLLENTFRSVNIAFINEMAGLCEKLDLNIWEVIEAAKTKPFGFMPFYPGPGIGGHCIPLDPMYLQWSAKNHDAGSKFIELAQETNLHMPFHAISKITEILNEETKSLKNSKILLVGISYKQDTEDYRESPNLKIFRHLLDKGAKVSYYDSHVPSISFGNQQIESIKDLENLDSYDCIVILTAHSEVDHADMLKFGVPVYDTRNVIKKKHDLVYVLGDGTHQIAESYIAALGLTAL